MTLSDAAETDILELIFNNTAWLTVAAAGALGNLYVSLHEGDPGDAGNQGTNEASYTGYNREAVARTTAGWTVTNDTVVNNGAITFDECTAGSSAVTHFGIGTDLTGVGNLLMSGALGATLSITAGITPEFADGQLSVTAE